MVTDDRAPGSREAASGVLPASPPVLVACVEAGYLERQATLLFESIRRWAGRYSGARIVAVQPRHGLALEPETLAAFRRMDVEYERRALNTEYERIHQANKLFAASWVEEHAAEDVVVFLDSDAFFMGEPTQFDLGEAEAAVRPTLHGGVATSTGPDDPNDAWWMRLYELCGVQSAPYVETTVDRQRVRAYFNGGLVVGRREAAVFRRWKENWLRLLEARHFPIKDGRPKVGTDQPALAATLARDPEAVRLLHWAYNYPLAGRHRLTGAAGGAKPEDLVHVHYKGCRASGSLLDYFDHPPPGSERAEWLRTSSLDALASPGSILGEARARGRRLERKVRELREETEQSDRTRKATTARLAAAQGSLWWRLGTKLGVAPGQTADSERISGRKVSPGDPRRRSPAATDGAGKAAGRL